MRLHSKKISRWLLTKEVMVTNLQNLVLRMWHPLITFSVSKSLQMTSLSNPYLVHLTVTL